MALGKLTFEMSVHTSQRSWPIPVSRVVARHFHSGTLMLLGFQGALACVSSSFHPSRAEEGGVHVTFCRRLSNGRGDSGACSIDIWDTEVTVTDQQAERQGLGGRVVIR